MAPPTRVPSFWTWVPPPGEAECRDRQISEHDPKKGISVPLRCYLRSVFPMLVHVTPFSPRQRQGEVVGGYVSNVLTALTH